jgi:hypothetical protein
VLPSVSEQPTASMYLEYGSSMFLWNYKTARCHEREDRNLVWLYEYKIRSVTLMEGHTSILSNSDNQMQPKIKRRT